VRDLRRFGRDFKPVSQNLADLTASLDKTGGLERFLDYLFFQNTAVNGFDSIGHYLRAALLVNLCSSYASTPQAGCNSTYQNQVASASNSLAPSLAKLQKARKGEKQGSVAPTGTLLKGLIGDPEDPAAVRQRERNIQRLRGQSRKPSPGFGDSADQAALDYLLGSDR
jgi:hypothetical protein